MEKYQNSIKLNPDIKKELVYLQKIQSNDYIGNIEETKNNSFFLSKFFNRIRENLNKIFSKKTLQNENKLIYKTQEHATLNEINTKKDINTDSYILKIEDKKQKEDSHIISLDEDEDISNNINIQINTIQKDKDIVCQIESPKKINKNENVNKFLGKKRVNNNIDENVNKSINNINDKNDLIKNKAILNNIIRDLKIKENNTKEELNEFYRKFSLKYDYKLDNEIKQKLQKEYYTKLNNLTRDINIKYLQDKNKRKDEYIKLSESKKKNIQQPKILFTKINNDVNKGANTTKDKTLNLFKGTSDISLKNANSNFMSSNSLFLNKQESVFNFTNNKSKLNNSDQDLKLSSKVSDSNLFNQDSNISKGIRKESVFE